MTTQLPNVRRCIVHIPVTYRRAGTEQIVLDLLHRCAAEGWYTAAVIPPSQVLDKFESEVASLGTQVARIGPLFESDRHPLRNLRELMRLFRALRPTIVHLHYPWAPTCSEAVLACWLSRVPVTVRTEHNPIVEPLSLRQRLKMHVLDRMVDRIVCVSAANRVGHIRNGRRPAAKFSVIPNGIAITDAARQQDLNLRAVLGLAPQSVLAVMVGALEERKGVLDLVRIAELTSHCEKLEFVVIGDGELKHTAENLASALGVSERVHFLGARHDVRDLLGCFDIYVQPSHYEGLSLSMLEALAAGLAMVSTAVDGVADVLGDSEGAMVIPIGDLPAFAAALVELAEDAALRGRLAAVTSTRVRSTFTVDAMCDGYMALYDEVLALTGGVPDSGDDMGR